MRDVHLQAGLRPVDVLWVVDDEPTMTGKVQTLVQSVPAWFAVAGSTIDYRMGVVTADPGDRGALRGDVPVVTNATPDPLETLAANLEVETVRPSGGEGFEAAHRCLSSNECAALDRGGGSDLYLVFVSDQPEQSVALGGVSDYVNAFRALRSGPERVEIWTISGGLSGCSGPNGSASSGSDYVAASIVTGGGDASVCAADYELLIADLAVAALRPPDAFELSRSPVASAIEVSVGGLRNDAWTWDPGSNSIAFDPGASPELGDEVVIEYDALGPPCVP